MSEARNQKKQGPTSLNRRFMEKTCATSASCGRRTEKRHESWSRSWFEADLLCENLCEKNFPKCAKM